MGVLMSGENRKSRVNVGRVKSEMRVSGEIGTMFVRLYGIRVVYVW